MKKSSLSLVLAFICAFASAEKIDIRFEAAAKREVWVLDQMPDRMPAAGRAFDSKIIPVETEGDSQVIVVHDPKTASVAIKMAGDVEGAWTVTDKEWRAAEVIVRAFSSGTPLPSGRIALHAPNFTKSVPVEGGEARFFAVPYGELEVRVDYKGGGIPATAPQIFRILKGSSAEQRTIGVTVVEPTGDAKRDEKSEPSLPSQEASPWYVNFVIWLVALAIGAVGLVFLMRFLKDRSDIVEEKLKGLGVPIPSDIGAVQSADDASGAKPFEAVPVVPDGHCAYCGKMLTDCICRLDAPKAASAPKHEFEFIGSGVELRIPEGESIIGREADLVILDPTVSRQHAKIVREADAIFLEDLGSSNGTFVDGVRIEERTAVRPGAVVHFGSVKVRFEG
ncbi:MAG: FHA domain-containing protein [Armatimonadota bacterium]|nr:FHA domain-containing protein [Armatimonadota bacterium]